MSKCPECLVYFDDETKICPLCGAACSYEQKTLKSMKPLYPKFIPFEQASQERFTILARIFLMISLLFGGASLIINVFTWQGTPWCLVVIGGIMLTWLLVGVPLLSNININHILILQFLGTAFYLWMIDQVYGNLGWALDYVIPLLYIAVAIVVAIFVLIFHNIWREYLITLIVMAGIGFIFLGLLFSRQLNVLWPSLSALFCAVLLIAGMLVFGRRKMGMELRRRMDL